MAFTSLHTLLQPQVILRVVSRIRLGQNRLGRWLGFQPTRYDVDNVTLAGPNTVQGDTRTAVFRTYDMARTVAKGRAPNTGPATIPVNPVGNVPVSCARFHMKIPLSYEELGNLSPVVGPNSQIDQGGSDYLRRMVQHIARRFNMLVELLAIGMMQDNLYFNLSGDDILVSIGPIAGSNFNFQVPFQIPAGNKNLLNMLNAGNIITGSWKLPTTPIIQHLMAIKAAYMQLSGFPLTDMWINSLGWYNTIVNTEVRNLAGSAATPFAEYDWVEEMGADGEHTGDYQAILKADPTVNIHITDEVVITNSDFDPVQSQVPAGAIIQKAVPDAFVYFATKPSSEWTQMWHGAEHVVENPGMPGVLRRGYYFWKEYMTQPSCIDLIGLLNCIPLLFVPKVIAPAQPLF